MAATKYYVGSLWHESSEPFVSVIGRNRQMVSSVIGRNRQMVSDKLDELAEEEFERCDDQDEGEYEDDITTGGVHEINAEKLDDYLPIARSERQEALDDLEEYGIAVV